jgi:hypothetical protein
MDQIIPRGRVQIRNFGHLSSETRATIMCGTFIGKENGVLVVRVGKHTHEFRPGEWSYLQEADY